MAEQQRNHTTTSASRDDDVFTLDVATPSDSVVTVIAHGEIDLDTAPRLHDCLRQHLRPGGSLVLDTTAVTNCGSSGAAELVGAATAARQVGAEITVVIPPTSRHPVRRCSPYSVCSTCCLFDQVRSSPSPGQPEHAAEVRSQPRTQSSLWTSNSVIVGSRICASCIAWARSLGQALSP